MRVALALLTVVVLVVPSKGSAQVAELPNIPVVTSGWQDKFWTHADGTKFHTSNGERARPSS